ncbi:hypothetical protein [Catenulispora rubra]|uniref:hypothetical protein n=1 Tax=Catenulispora rubra TaxID=280293 RepID=UPI0018923FF8|nr:hypothetical protein [Catenulispora rubra]
MEAKGTGFLLVTLINDGEADDLMVFPLVEDQDLIRRWARLKGYRDTDLYIRPTPLNCAAELFADEMRRRTR